MVSIQYQQSPNAKVNRKQKEKKTVWKVWNSKQHTSRPTLLNFKGEILTEELQLHFIFYGLCITEVCVSYQTNNGKSKVPNSCSQSTGKTGTVILKILVTRPRMHRIQTLKPHLPNRSNLYFPVNSPKKLLAYEYLVLGSCDTYFISFWQNKI